MPKMDESCLELSLLFQITRENIIDLVMANSKSYINDCFPMPGIRDNNIVQINTI